MKNNPAGVLATLPGLKQSKVFHFFEDRFFYFSSLHYEMITNRNINKKTGKTVNDVPEDARDEAMRLLEDEQFIDLVIGYFFATRRDNMPTN